MLETQSLDAGIVELRMARPPVNALNPDLLAAIAEGLDKAVADGAQGIVFSGAPGMFSAGLDVPYLLTLERPALESAWQAFFTVCSKLAFSPVPVAAAITGHSPAGGAVMSLFCDYRVMAEGSFRIGLNEVQVGLVVPDPIQAALRRLVGDYRAERLLVAGAMLESVEALRVGLVDELATPEQVVQTAARFLASHLSLPRSAMLRTREMARADLREAIGKPGSVDLSPFMEAWFEDETQQVLGALVARLKSKK
ncbi:enoyl-CoA hydratase/isomerase family protein [Pseudomarimonas salicorniae]|uniref:Enoyl-CoA hydratase/isomerase family protein n=1 Tax=Pseudomarimonas salicorniae TaxID=2933270 RepID=A0ABT0GLI1_9GAMM|nr:enoyl-CoA hydratase/isomerase family protein [Lysobacter sp. CAU 1642]MCK7595273.1 enoyl-CoA hydratase/isomerase family protein [Lysobacter sp. CAU 1642]